MSHEFRNTGQRNQVSARHVGACSRCQSKKIRCDQLPSCTNCTKSGTECTNFDPVAKRYIPRSYILHLEERTQYLERILDASGLPFLRETPLDAQLGLKKNTSATIIQSTESPESTFNNECSFNSSRGHTWDPQIPSRSSCTDTLSPRKRARLHSPQKDATKSFTGELPLVSSIPAGGGYRMRLPMYAQSIPGIQPASLPDREVARHLIKLYFERSNSQIPILHETEFMDSFKSIFGDEDRTTCPDSLFKLNIVLAIGKRLQLSKSAFNSKGFSANNTSKNPPNQADGPEHYYAAATCQLEIISNSFKSCSDTQTCLDEIQNILLISALALLMPVSPGLWYTVGVAVRLSVDLGLHRESQYFSGHQDVSMTMNGSESTKASQEWSKDLKRRLWWCVYSFDRIVSTCTERPLGVPDEVISTSFPSLLKDSAIASPESMGSFPRNNEGHKLVARHVLKYRRLQSELLQVVQNLEAQHAWTLIETCGDSFLPMPPVSSSLLTSGSYRAWQTTMFQKLQEWIESAPSEHRTGLGFMTDFFQLNYWQAVMMLYRQRFDLPGILKQKFATTQEVICRAFSHDDSDDESFHLTLAEAGRHVLQLYRKVQQRGNLTYPYLATHHIFLAATTIMHSFWHSPSVQKKMSTEELDMNILVACSVLVALAELCSPAKDCAEALEMMCKRTIERFLCKSRSSHQTSYSDCSEMFARHDAVLSQSEDHSDSNLEPVYDSESLIYTNARASSERHKLMVQNDTNTNIPPLPTGHVDAQHRNSNVNDHWCPALDMYDISPSTHRPFERLFFGTKLGPEEH